MSNLYITGARVSGTMAGTFAVQRAVALPGSFDPNNAREQLIDQVLLSVRDVLAVEMYRSFELPRPVRDNVVGQTGRVGCGATLIWTK